MIIVCYIFRMGTSLSLVAHFVGEESHVVEKYSGESIRPRFLETSINLHD